MKIHGQRWLYRVGNAEVIVDNAFSWWGWGQERWLINGEIIREAAGWFAPKRSFDEPWLTPLGDGILAAELRAKIASVECLVTLDGEAQPDDARLEASWSGRGVWPADEAWTEVENFSIFNALKSRGRIRRKTPAD
jgi:hypothetical protein